MLEHGVFGSRVVEPTLARLQIHRTQLPALDRVAVARLEPLFLLGIADRKPIFYQNDSRANQHALELRDRVQEFAVLLVRAEAHHMLHSRAVVPTAIEE